MTDISIDSTTNLAELQLPADMRREVETALSEDTDIIHYRCLRDYDCPDNSLHLLFFPCCRRGAACQSGDSLWTDCRSLYELEDSWQESRASGDWSAWN